ncbi:hypothetical protein niasHT_023138 [Heterodera trifolii]|uniref:FAD-dependent oxidoreductase domain-containing protein 1 n=1 Tax=Heterodera trifolii TaxID=157864 RepID=A0ABD2JDX6_9BILA
MNIVNQRILQTHVLNFASTSSRFLSFTQCKHWQPYENERYFEPGQEFWDRGKHILTYEFRRAARRYREAKYDAFRRRHPLAHMKVNVNDYELLPMHCEYLIIGGGLTGSAAAYWLKQGFRDENLSVTVLESTENFAKTRSLLGSGVITQQFSTPEMIDMAMFSAEFLRHAGEHLKILDNEPPDIHLLPCGVMHLARTEEDAEQFRNAWKLQVDRGANVILIGREELSSRFPFMNFDDVVLGTVGLENEGIFDTWQLLSALREKNMTLGVRYLKGDMEGTVTYRHRGMQEHGRTTDTADADAAEQSMQTIRGAIVRPQMTGATPRRIQSFRLINAAGPWAGEVARRAGLGQKGGVMSVPLPIVCTRRTNFIVHAPQVPVLQMPILMDPSGIFCRPDNVGHNYVCGRIPTKKDAVKMAGSKPEDDPPIDYDEFFEQVFPALIQRVPSFRDAKVINAWHSYEDFNTFDNLPVIGEHLMDESFFQLCGFGGYGPQMAIAAGRMFMERIFDFAYSTVNLRKFDMRRIMHGERLHEQFRCV